MFWMQFFSLPSLLGIRLSLTTPTAMSTGRYIYECNCCYCLLVLLSTSLACRGTGIWHPTWSSKSTGNFAHTAVNNMVSSVDFPLLPDCLFPLHTSVEQHPWSGIQRALPAKLPMKSSSLASDYYSRANFSPYNSQKPLLCALWMKHVICAAHKVCWAGTVGVCQLLPKYSL